MPICVQQDTINKKRIFLFRFLLCSLIIQQQQKNNFIVIRSYVCIMDKVISNAYNVSHTSRIYILEEKKNKNNDINAAAVKKKPSSLFGFHAIHRCRFINLLGRRSYHARQSLMALLYIIATWVIKLLVFSSSSSLE